jgi:hypothetical protein
MKAKQLISRFIRTSFSFYCAISICLAFIGTLNAQNTLFFDDFNGAITNWTPNFPNAMVAVAGGNATYVGASGYSLQVLNSNSVLRMGRSLTDFQRCGWSTTQSFSTNQFRYEVRFNSLQQSSGSSIDGFLEIWILDAANSNRFDFACLFGGWYGTDRRFAGGSSIDGTTFEPVYSFADNAYYRLVIEGSSSENIHALLLSDSGTELKRQTFSHTTSAYSSGFKLAITQVMGSPGSAYPVDVAVDFARLTSSPSCVSSPSGIVSWWSGENNANDNVGTNNGAFSGGTFVSGKVGQAFSFNGSSSSITVNNGVGNFGTNDFTVECWIRTASTREETIMGKRVGCGGSSFWNLRLNGGGVYVEMFPNGSSSDVVGFTSTRTINDNQFHHVALVRNRLSTSLYIDGMLDTTASTIAVVTLNNTASMLMGTGPCSCCGVSSFTGQLDEISIFSRALALNEVQSIYNAGSFGKCPVTAQAPTISAQPQSRSANAGASVTFSVTADGTAPLSYQWRREGTNIATATGATLQLTNVQLANAGTYSVIVTNSAGSILSSNASLTINTNNSCVPIPSGAVAWWRGEGNATDELGIYNGTATGTAFVSGNTGQAFSFNGTGSSVSFGSSLGNFGTNNFTIECWIKTTSTRLEAVLGKRFGCGDSSFWNFRLLNGAIWVEMFPGVNFPDNASFSSQPINDGQFHHLAVVRQGLTVTLYVDGIFSGNAATVAVLDFTNTANLLAGTGPCDSPFTGQLDEITIYNRPLSLSEIQNIYNAGGNGKCSTPSAPSITQQPQNQTVSVGASVTFNVGATGTSPLSYLWLFNGTNIPGATESALVLTNVQDSNAGSYSVVVSNQVGSTVSSNALLTIVPVGTSTFSPGLVAYYPFDGNANDVASNHNCVVNSAILTTDRFQRDQGAYHFNANASIQSTNGIGITGNSPRTVSCWIRPGATNADVQIWGWGTGSTANYFTESMYTAGRPYLFYLDNNYANCQFVDPTNTWLFNQWIHVVTVYSTNVGNAKFYINGTNYPIVAFDFGSSNAVLNTQDSPFSMGGIPSHRFTGDMDDIRVYNRALSASEVQQLYQYEANPGTTAAPVIFTQPSNQTVTQGATAQFSVGAFGQPGLSYQWLFNGTNIASATGSALTITNSQTTDAGNYSVIVSNSVGSITSSNALLTVFPPTPPSITQQPQNTTVLRGANATFNVSATGSAPLFYQWRFDGTNLANATSTTLVQTNVQLVDAGPYSVVISNAGGFAISTNALLTVIDLGPNFFDDFEPGIDTFQWAGFSATVRATNYGGSVSGSNSLWFGGTGSRYAVTRALNTTNGGVIEFYLRLASGSSSVNWETVDLPSEGVVLEYSSTTNVWTEIGRYDTTNFYNWTFVTLDIPAGAKGNSVQFRWRQLANSGSANDHWALDDAAISIGPRLAQIVTQPSSQTLITGQTATFSVTANGTAPLNFQWRLNGTNFLSATNSTLVLTNVQLGDSGSYSVEISNAAGSIVSSNAILTVTLPPANIRVVNTTNMAGAPVSVSVVLVANGNENAVSFSLNFNTQRLFYANTVVGSNATGGNLLLNSAGSTNGQVGIAVGLPPGNTFALGIQEVARINFNSAILTGSNSVQSPVTFGDLPIVRQLSDAQAHVLSATFSNGVITLLPTELEADTAPRPDGNRAVTVIDWVQVGRFVARLDTPANGSEFQRADCAPRDTSGDGQLRATDWVQAGRYAAGLDSIRPIGGPNVETITNGFAPTTKGATASSSASDEREVSIYPPAVIVPNVPISFSIRLQAQGDENALTFSLIFDPAVIRFSSIALGSSSTGASLNTNISEVSAGKLGVALGLPIGSTFPSGQDEIVTVTFMPVSATPANNSAITFGNAPIPRGISDDNAHELSATYTPAFVSYVPQVLSTSSFANGSFQFTMSGQAGTNYIVQASTNLVEWTPISTNVATGNGTFQFTDPGSSNYSGRYYRVLRAP